MNIDKPVVFINPELKNLSTEMFELWDDCMSFPNLLVKVKRHKHLTIQYLDEKWQHIDLTWDDPTTSNGKPILIHDFFLIDTSELERISNKLKNNQHVFDKNIYIEAK